jgi:hypothetical protein
VQLNQSHMPKEMALKDGWIALPLQVARLSWDHKALSSKVFFEFLGERVDGR